MLLENRNEILFYFGLFNFLQEGFQRPGLLKADPISLKPVTIRSF